MMRRVCLLLLISVACGKQTTEPSASGGSTEPVAAALDTQRRQATGRWCSRSMVNRAGQTVLDGTTWELNADGSYAWAGELTVRGTWTLAPDKLTLSESGEYAVEKLEAEHMRVSRAGLQYQLHRDCGPEIVEGRKLSALRKAAAKGDALMVNSMLAAGGLNVDKPDPFHVLHHTALMSAIDGKHVEVVELLLKHGASVTGLSGNQTVFELARRRDNPEITRLLTEALPEPKTLDVSAVLDKADQAPCPQAYIELLSKCVHTYVLPRPTLTADVAAIANGAPSPTLRGWAPAEAPAAMKPVAAVFEDVAVDFGNSSALGPGSLMRKGGPIKGTSTARNLPELRKESPKPTSKSSNDSKYEASPEEKKWAADYTKSSGGFDEDKFKRDMCAQYRPALARVRRGEMPPGSTELGFTQADAINAIEANIQSCAKWGL